MGYKTTSAERTQATSAISSAIAAFNNPDGSGFALTSTALTEGVGLKQYTIIPGTNPVNSETSIGGAVITAVAITDSNYAVLDDTALATTGGYIKLTGTGFKTGCIVYVGGVAATTTTFVSSTEVRAAIGSNSSNTFTVSLANPDGSAGFYMAGIAVNGVPAWSTNATLSAAYEQAAYSQTLTANSNSSIAYSLKSGSTLPAGVSLNSSTGVLSGTTPADTGTTTYTFTIIATDAENQDTERLFSLTINTDTVNWSSPAAGTSYTITPTVTVSNISLSASALSGRAVTYSANTLPTGLTLSNGVIFGTISGSSHPASTLLTATNSYRPATRVINWNLVLSDLYFKYTTLLLNGESLAGTGNTWIKDSSTNNFAITTAGDARSNNFSPFNTSWSNYFNGSSCVRTVANSNLAIGTGDVTVEFWLNTFSNSDNGLFGTTDEAAWNSTSWSFKYSSSAITLYNGNGGGDLWSIATGTLHDGVWRHIAIVRSSGTWQVFVDGVSKGTTATQGSRSLGNNTWRFAVGCIEPSNSDLKYTGYISNFRLNNTALYSANFTPSTTPLTAVAGTLLLTCQSNRFIDNSVSPVALTIASAPKVVGFSPFTETDTLTGSGYFDGTGDRLTTPSNAAFILGTGDYTYECWVYHTDLTNQQTYFARGTAGNYNGVYFYKENTTNYIAVYYTSQIVASNVVVGLNQWVHLAACRASGTLRLFINGTQVGSASDTTNLTESIVQVGADADGTNGTKGYISNARVLKGTALYTTTFTPPTAPLTAIANTSLLTLQSRQSANNNSFLDDSTNKSLITRNGNATQGTFTPFSQTGWSNNFNSSGNTDAISFPSNAAYNIGTGNFTVEFWLNPTAFSGNNQRFFLMGVSGTTNLGVEGQSAGSLTVVFQGSTIITYSWTPSFGTWYHVAVCRVGSTVTLYINGVSVSTATSSTSISNNVINVGSLTWAGSFNVKGYLSNVRFSANTAFYTSNFTPSTAPLTAISGTALLTCQSNRFVDNSSINAAVTVTGTPSVQAFSPFLPTTTYNTSTVGGSGYFDGTGDYLTVADNAAFTLGTNDFTLEFWVYPLAGGGTSGNPIIFEHGQAGDWGSWIFQWLSKTTLYFYAASSAGAGSYNVCNQSMGTLVANQWTHVVVTRSGSTFTGYKNGVVVFTSTSALSLQDQSSPVTIGRHYNSTSEDLQGYIAGARIVNGTAIYTAAFTPPTAPPTAVSNTQLLLNFTNAGIIDSASKNDLETVGTAKISTVQSKYGTTSIYFDGTSGNRLQVSSTVAPPNFNMGTGDYTVEFWMYSGTPGSQQCLFDFRNDDVSGQGIAINYRTDRTIALYMQADRITTPALTANTWTHVAAVRLSGVYTVYINGVSGGTWANADVVAPPLNRPYIGAVNNGTQEYIGYIDDLRVTKGIARYTTSFTPPTAALLL
jgi:hypothetical protein